MLKTLSPSHTPLNSLEILTIPVDTPKEGKA